MIPYKWIGIGLAVLALMAGAYFKGHAAGEAKVQAILDEQRQTWQEAFAKQAADTATKEATWAEQNKELENAWKAKLDVAESNVNGLSARLRRAALRGSGCSMPGDSAPAGASPDSAVPISSAEIERLSDDAWRACAADSLALSEVVTRYNNLRNVP